MKVSLFITPGDNSTFGGDVIAGIHPDGIITKPKLFVDDEEFILSLDV